jgi:alkyl hydroperoxide reductase subunit D
MSNFEVKIDSLPDFAKDLKLNVKSVVFSEGVLSKKQVGIIAIASSIATKNKALIDDVYDYFSQSLSEQELKASKSAAAIMGMNNIYYRFTHMVSDKSYEKMSAGLRMNVIASHGIEKIDFELASLAVSAINGCGMCIDSHEQTLKKHNVALEQIQLAIKIAAVLNGVSTCY